MRIWKIAKHLSYLLVALVWFFAITSCKPPAQDSVTDIIQTHITLSADRPSNQPYDSKNKIKFTAIVIPQYQSEIVGGSVQFKYDNNGKKDWQNGCINVPVSKTSDGNMQATCDLDLKGGMHTVTAYYSGLEKVYTPSNNTASMDYTVTQADTKITDLTIAPTSGLKFGDKVTLTVLMNKDPNMPEYSGKNGGTVAFSITQEKTAFFGLRKTTSDQNTDICTDDGQIKAENKPDGTTFTCEYIIKTNIITDPNTKNDDPYSIQINAYYKGNSYYAPSPVFSIQKININKISPQIQNITADHTGYIPGGDDPAIVRAQINSTGGIAFLSNPILMFDDNKQPLNADCSIKPPEKDSASYNIECKYSVKQNDIPIPPHSRCFVIEYPGDIAYTKTQAIQTPPCPQFTNGHVVSITSVSANPSIQTLGGQVTITGILKPVIDKDQPPKPENLQLAKSFDTTCANMNDKASLKNCNFDSNDKTKFTCTYETQSGDPQYNCFKVFYKNDNYYADALSDTAITGMKINKIDSQMTWEPLPSETKPINESLKIQIKVENYNEKIPLQKFKIYNSKDPEQNSICDNLKPDTDKIITCEHKITTQDFDWADENKKITFTASISKDDPNYQDTMQTSTPVTIDQISQTFTVYPPGKDSDSKLPYTMTLSGNLTKVDGIPFTEPKITVQKSFDKNTWNDAQGCKDTSVKSDGSFSCASQVNFEDYANITTNNELYLKVTFTDGKYYKSQESTQTITLSLIKCTPDPSAINIKYNTDCDPHTACNLKINCSNIAITGSNNITFNINNLQDSAGFKLPNSGGNIFDTPRVNCASNQGNITCSNFAPISKKMSISGTLQINTTSFSQLENVSVIVDSFNYDSTKIHCGMLDQSSVQNFHYTSTQQMFDCYARVQNAIGYYDDEKGKTLTPDMEGFNTEKSWYLFACPDDTNRDTCAWLSPIIPRPTQWTNGLTRPSWWDDPKNAPSTALIPDIKDGIPTQVLPPTLMINLVGKRILWSGVLEAPKIPNNDPNNRQNFNFFYTNGFSPRPGKDGYPKLEKDAQVYGAYTAFITMPPTSPNSQCTDLPYMPWNTWCWLGHTDTIFNWSSTQFPTSWHDTNNAHQYTVCAPKDGPLGVQPPNCMGMVGKSNADPASDTWINVRDYFLKKTVDNKDTKKYAYVDVCRRRSVSDPNAEKFDTALIRPDQYSWQVPSYPVLLTLTGQSHPDGDQTCAKQSPKDQAITRCLVTNITPPITPEKLQIAGFYGTNTTIPGFNTQDYLWSSDIVMDQVWSSGGDCAREACQWDAFAFHDGSVMPLKMNYEATASVRCISLDW